MPSIIIYKEHTNSERLLNVLHPVFAWLAKHIPQIFGPPKLGIPHPSAMLERHNWLWRLIFPRFFERIKVEQATIDELKGAALNSTLIYLTKGIGQLEYHYFNHLFMKEGLPLAVYTNALTLRRWKPWSDYWNSILSQEEEIGKLGRPFDPLIDGEIPRLIASGKSILLSISASSLAEDGLYFTGPTQAALLALVESARVSTKPISVVPLEFLWSHHPESTKRSVIDILFGEKDSPGAIRKTVLFWRNYKTHAQASIGHPIDLSSFIQWEGGTDVQIASKLRDMLMEALKAKRRSITGPPIRPRRLFIQEVIGDEELEREICRTANEKGKCTDDIRELATQYTKEIAANIDYTWIELLDKILIYAFNRIFDSFEVDEIGLTRAKELSASGPVVFIPNHKSHADYLILSHILYHHGMTVPHIAAGINLEFWPLGPIFRRGGAYFIRRAFRDNLLYRAVLETYLKVLLKEGYCQEFFIEGGRSRTGKLCKPRKGMLTILHRAAERAHITSLHFIPVSITYDRVIEQKSYERELEGGMKQQEGKGHLLGLAKFLKRQRHRYGSLYVRFGEPILAIRGAQDLAIEKLAYNICHNINSRIVVTASALCAAALLVGTRRGIPKQELVRNWECLLSFLVHRGVEISNRITTVPNTSIVEAIALLSQAKLIIPRIDAIEPFFAVSEERRIPLSFYKNSIVHFFVSAGIVSAILVKRYNTKNPISLSDLYSDFIQCCSLLEHEFGFATHRIVEEEMGKIIDFFISHNAIEHTANGHLTLLPREVWIAQLLMAQVMPFLETLFIAVRHITERTQTTCDEHALIQGMMQTGNDLFLLGHIHYRESISKVGFESALKSMASAKLMERAKGQPESKGYSFYQFSQDLEAINIFKAKLEKLL